LTQDASGVAAVKLGCSGVKKGAAQAARRGAGRTGILNDEELEISQAIAFEAG
jgi:hypothetical protein